MICELFFISKSTYPRGHMSDVAILLSAQANNARKGLTGCLIRGSDWFAQSLEGPPDVVKTLFQRIKDDPLHSDLQVWWGRDRTQRRYEDWRMIVADVDQYEAQLHAALRSNVHDGDTKFAKMRDAVWRHTDKFNLLPHGREATSRTKQLSRPEQPQYSL